MINELFPSNVLAQVTELEFPVASVGDLSGKREYHNETRHYFDEKNIAAFPCVRDIAETFQAPHAVAALETFFNTDLEDTFLRIEYAQDITGFWLEPHTDLGVKRITMLIYLSDGTGHEDLGTDIYDGEKKWAKRSPFQPNVAMAFVPGDNTYHGFENRPINGVRKSLILNYVTKDWRDREQLCFPGKTVSKG